MNTGPAYINAPKLCYTTKQSLTAVVKAGVTVVGQSAADCSKCIFSFPTSYGMPGSCQLDNTLSLDVLQRQKILFVIKNALSAVWVLEMTSVSIVKS